MSCPYGEMKSGLNGPYKNTRFSLGDILLGKKMLTNIATDADIDEVIRIYDRGCGTIEDVIDRFEDDPGY